MYNIIKLVTLPDSRKFDFCYIIHLDVYLLWSVIISVIVEIWLVKLWWTATSSPICLMSRVSFIIFIICVIQCHKRIVLILMCLIGLHKWPIRLHKRLIWFYYDIAFDILVLTFTMCRCPIPIWVLFRHTWNIKLCILYGSCCHHGIRVWTNGIQSICDLLSLKFHSWELSWYVWMCIWL